MADEWWANQEDKEQVIRLFIEEYAEQSPRKRAGTDMEPSQFHKPATALTVEETWKLFAGIGDRWNLLGPFTTAVTSGNLFATARSQMSLLPPTLHQCSTAKAAGHTAFILFPPTCSSLFEIQVLLTLKMVSKAVHND
jgi:hypothetical protein